MDLQQSLRDIAELLLLIYDRYIKSAVSNDDVSFSLLSLLHSLNLLGNSISVLEAEYLRRSVLSTSKENDGMDYDQFYAWLRKVAEYWHQQGQSSAIDNSLERLLIERILPRAVAGFNEENHLSKSILMEPAIYDAMQPYLSFLKITFGSGVSVIEV
mgnify:CR=1 FL=1